MTHLKHSGPIRQAAHAKRTAMVEVLSDEPAANESAAFREIDESANADARAIVAQPRAMPTWPAFPGEREQMELQVAKNRQDPLLQRLYD